MRKKNKIFSMAMILIFAVAFLVPNFSAPKTAAASISYPTVKTLEAEDVSEDSATLNAEITTDGDYDIVEYGFYYSTSDSVGPDDDSVEAGTGDLGEGDTFDATIDDLDSDQDYYFRAYIVYEDDAGDTHERLSSSTYNRDFTTDEDDSSSDDVEVTTNDADVGDDYATINGEVTDDGGYTVDEYGFFYGTDESDVEDGEDGSADWDEADSGDQDDFSLDIEDLDTDETYYYMAYAEVDGDYYYGDVESFDFDDEEGTPEVSTDSATDIDSNSATLNGTIESFGDDNEITEYGFYYGTSSSPSSKKIAGDDSDNIDEGDDFDYDLSGLKSNTKYYFKAYAKNSEGTAYGSVKSFTTDGGGIPLVSTKTTSAGSGSATLYGAVTDQGDEDINSYGFYYGQTSSPTNRVTVGTSIDEGNTFNYNLQGLSAGTYYVKAYATNDEGTGYGTVQSFTVSSASNPSTFTINSKSYYINGSYQTMDAAPYIKNNRTYMPIRYVGYAMGLTDANIVWNEASRTVVLTKGNTSVILIIGSRTMYVNGVARVMDVAPEITSNRTCLPIAWVASAFGSTATWDSTAKTVTIR